MLSRGTVLGGVWWGGAGWGEGRRAIAGGSSSGIGSDIVIDAVGRMKSAESDGAIQRAEARTGPFLSPG